MKRIADSTVRRLSAYLRFLEESARRGITTISSDELAKRGGTTSAQVRKDLSFFGSFGKRGLGYAVDELIDSLREILGLGRQWSVIIVGAGKIGTALAQYEGFRRRGFIVSAIYDRDPRKVGESVSVTGTELNVRDIAQIERDIARDKPDIAVLTVPGEDAQALVDRLVRAGVKAILNFAPVQLRVPADVALRSVNMAMELEGLSFALSNRNPTAVHADR
ncbi:MAG TPA: redox-sensing transcriptional repressor Rex [Gemmatimonadaceae bacterium]|nr:redox-sensing transcriptional repressor Rex [Gemmatimonadaceae bacterium]